MRTRRKDQRREFWRRSRNYSQVRLRIDLEPACSAGCPMAWGAGRRFRRIDGTCGIPECREITAESGSGR